MHPGTSLLPGGIIIHGKKTPDHEVIIDGFDPGRDKKTESDNRYQIWVAMPNSPLETREIIVSVNNTKTGQLEFEPLELHLNPSGDPINLIIMDVVMKKRKYDNPTRNESFRAKTVG